MTRSRMAIAISLAILLAMAALLIALPAIGQNDDYGVATTNSSNTATPNPPTATSAPPTATPSPVPPTPVPTNTPVPVKHRITPVETRSL